MNILNEDLLTNENELNNFINIILNNIKLNFNILENHKQILMNYILKIADFPTENIETNIANLVVSLLTNLKDCMSIIDNTTLMLNNFKDKLNNKDNYNIESLNVFLTEYNDISTAMSNNIIKIDEFLAYSTKFFLLSFSDDIDDVIPKTENANVPSPIKDNSLTNNSNNNITANCSNCNIIENTLIISEIHDKVILPFTINDLNAIWEENKEQYNTMNDLIEDRYTIPYSNFKNFTFSRFKETFKLARNIEHKSIRESFNLALELMFNYDLHPAIITACKNIDQLDIYLDYLETNETDKFDFFNIKFEIAPTLK